MNIKAMLLTTASLSIVASFPAQAQDEDKEGLSVGEIVVTAQRRSESINDVAMAVQAFGEEELTDQRVSNVRDLTALVPSFTVSQSYSGVPTYTLRGIGFNTVNLSATSTVGTYVDEVAYAYPIMNTGPLMDLERIEVLKGPQGTLYGRNTTAGLVGFVTAKPTTEFEGGATVEVGNYQTYNFETHLSGPIADGIQARIAFKTENSDKGWQVSNSRPNDRLGKIDRWGVRGSLAIQPTSRTNVDLSVTYWRNKSDTVAAQGIGFTPSTDPAGTGSARLFNAPGLAAYIAANPPTRASQADWAPDAVRSTDIGTGLGFKGPLRENNRFWGLKLRIDQELGDNAKIVSLTGYNDFRRNARLDYSGVPYEILLQEPVGRIKSFSEDIHIEGETGPVNWLVGGYYANDKILDSNRTLLGENANVPFVRFVGSTLLASPFNSNGYTATEMAQAFRTFEDIGNIRTRTWSLFGNADWRLSDQFKLTAGLRYTEDTQRYNGCSRDSNGNFLPTVNVVNRALFLQVYGVLPAPITIGQCNTFNPLTGTFGEGRSTLKENNVAWRAALDWTPDNDLLVFASVSHGAKAGTTPINAANLARQNAPVKQELLTAYELGLKSTMGGGTVQINASAFYYDYKDKQISTFFADPIYTALTRLDNVPKSEAYGVEGDFTWRPVPELTLTASGVWLHTEVKGYLGTNAAGLPQDFSGAPFIYSPKLQGSFSATFDQPITQNLAIKASINGRYQSKSNSVFENLPLHRIPGYGVWNGSIGIHDGDDQWALTIWARNLFNQYYWTAVATNANTVVRFPSPARTFGLSASVNF